MPRMTLLPDGSRKWEYDNAPTRIDPPEGEILSEEWDEPEAAESCRLAAEARELYEQRTK